MPSDKRDGHSDVPTPYAVLCDCARTRRNKSGRVYLTRDEYVRQMDRPDSTWRWPCCRSEAVWDDDNYEARTEGR